MREDRTNERLPAPPGIPAGRLGAGELAALESMSSGQGDFMRGALYGLPLERVAEVSSLAARLGIRPQSEAHWLLPLVLGHVARVASRIPQETREAAEAAAERLSADLDCRAAMLASLDDSVGVARASADRAVAVASKAEGISSGIGRDLAAVTENALAGLPETAKAAAAAAAEATVTGTLISIERRVQEAEAALSRVGLEHAAALKLAAHDAGEQMGTRALSVAAKIEARFKLAAKVAVFEAAQDDRRSDPWMRAKIGAVAAVFIAMCAMSAWLGWLAGSSEGERAGAGARMERIHKPGRRDEP